MTQHYTMLQRNLLYTGVTRGKRLVVLVGQRKAVAIAVRNVSGRRRWSKLKEWLVTTVISAPGPDHVRARGSSRLAAESIRQDVAGCSRTGLDATRPRKFCGAA